MDPASGSQLWVLQPGALRVPITLEGRTVDFVLCARPREAQGCAQGHELLVEARPPRPFLAASCPQNTLISHVGYSFFRIPSYPPPFFLLPVFFPTPLSCLLLASL